MPLANTLSTPRRDYAGWFMRAGVMAAFISFGMDKFDSRPNGEWVQIFARIGFGQWFRIATGVIEIGGGVLYLFSRTNLVGAALLASTMLGATVAHFTVLRDPLSSMVTLTLLAAVVGVALRIPDAPSYRERRTSRDSKP